MVAIFTGLGAGFERGSRAALGAGGLLGSSAVGNAGVQASFNAANGNLILQHQDAFLVGKGPDIAAASTYNSLAGQFGGDFNRASLKRAVFSLTGTINTTGSTITRVSADYSKITYTWNGSYYATTEGAGAHDRLDYDTYWQVWKWTDGDSGVEEIYGNQFDTAYWGISTERDRDGNALNWSYGSDWMRITSQDGSYVEYHYTSGRVSEIVSHYVDLSTATAKTATQTRYTYDSQGRLSSYIVDLSPEDNAIADGKVFTTTYTYVGSTNYIATVTQSDGSSLAITYDGSNRVSQWVETAASGDTRTTSISYFTGYTQITDPRGQTAKLYYNASGQLTQVVAPPAVTGAPAQTVTYTYDGDGNVLTVTDAGGAVTTYTYDSRGNVLTITDPNGNITTRSYNDKNEILEETRTGSIYGDDAASLITRYVYDDAGHLRYLIHADGGMTEYRYTDAGELAATLDYLDLDFGPDWHPDVWSITYWRDYYWDKTRINRTDYIYDARGDLAQSIAYAVTASDGEGDASEGAIITNFAYDQQGRLIGKQVGDQQSETYVYDGLGRVTAATDLAGGATTFVYNDAATTTTVTTASGYTIVKTYNKTGELISSVDSGANTTGGTVSYLYDKNGQLRRTTDANGDKAYVLYDKTGRKIADIGAGGQLIEYRYDAQNRLIATTRYKNVLTSTQLASLDDPNSEIEIATIRPSLDATNDLWAWSIYDAGGRVIETIQGDGSVTAYAYDNADRLIKTTGFYNKLTSTQLASFRSAAPSSATLPTSDSRDVFVRNFYDADGRLLGTLNGEGVLHGAIYDKAGQKLEDYAYSNPVDVSLRSSATMQEMIDDLEWDDDHSLSTRYVYDKAGLLRFTLDPLNRVTEYIYQDGAPEAETGVVRKTISYTTPLASWVEANYDSVAAAVSGLGAVGDRSSYAVYNDRGQLSYSVDAGGEITSFVYDSEGRIIKTTQFASLVDMTTMGDDDAWKANLDTWASTHLTGAHITRTYYDARGEARFVVDAEGYVTRQDFDAEGQITQRYRYATALVTTDSTTLANVDAANKGSVVTEQFAYDGLGRLSSATDANGNVHAYGYSATGVLLWDIAASGSADEAKTLIQYDLAGRKISETSAYGTAEAATVSYAYDGLGNLTTITDARANVTTLTYDKAGRVLTRTDALSGAASFAYDAFGRGVKTVDALGNASYAYFDRAGRVTLAIDAEGYATETAYTAFGEIASVKRYAAKTTGASISTPPTLTTNALDATTSFEYDKLGRVTKATDAEGAYEQYAYNAFGLRTSARNKLGGVTTYTYDLRGLTATEVLPISSVNAAGAVVASSVTNKFIYDARGNLTQKIEAFGLAEQRTTNYVYDGGNRLISKSGDALTIAATATAATSTITPTESYIYDHRGDLIEKVDAAGARTLYWYDKQGRVTHSLSSTGALTRSFYDAAGNLIETRSYGALETLPANATGTPPAGSGSVRTKQYVYDALGRLAQEKTLGATTASYNGTLSVATNVTLTTTYDYDALGHVVRTTDARGGQTYAYYDKLGHKTSEIDAELYRTDWTYDGNGDVLSETRFAAKSAAPSSLTSPPSAPASSADDRTTIFTYDKRGQRLTEKRLAVKINSTTTPGTYATTDSIIAYQYNGLGEVTRKTEASGDYIQYSYDVGGRMSAEQRSAYTDVNGASVTPTVQYSYDGLGDLTRSVSLGAGGAIATADRVATYVYGAGGRLLSTTDAEGFTHTYRYDAAGRKTRDEYTRVTTDGSNALEANGADYDLEGRITQSGALVWTGTNWSRSVLNGSAQETNATSVMHYDAFGEVIERGVNGVYSEQFSYDDTGRLIKTNSGDGVWKYFAYDEAGNQTLALISEGTDLTGLSLSQVMDLWGTNRANIATTWVDGVTARITQYDKRNQAILVREPQRELNATTKSDLTTQRAYNAFGETAYEINALGARIDYTYNTMGRLVKRESPTVQGVGENGLWYTGYDSNGAPTATSTTATTFRPTEQFYYDASGRLTASRDANGNLTRQTLLAGTGYNGTEALVTQAIAADGGTVRTYYDIQGDARRIEDQLYTSSAPTLHFDTQTFDRLGRLTQLNHSGGLVDYYAYDGLGQLIKSWNNFLGNSDINNVERTYYDQQGRITKTYSQGGDLTQYGYVWNAGITTTGLSSAAFGGWVQTTTYANNKTLIENSDIFNHLVSKTDLGGSVTGFTYDKAGRLVQRSGGGTLSYSYYNTGRIAVAVGLSGTIGANQIWDRVTQSYGYDQVGNLTSERVDQDGQTVLNYYGGYGTTTSTTVSYSRVVENATAQYDALARLTDWNEAGNAIAPTAWTSISYDAAGNIRRSRAGLPILDANGNQSASSSTDYWYRYDALNHVVTERGVLQGGTIVRGSGDGIDIAYNLAGQRVYSMTSFQDQYISSYTYTTGYGGTIATPVYTAFTNTRREDYAYDAGGHLTQVYIGVGTQAAPTPSSAGILRSSFTFDLMGRNTGQTDYSDAGVMQYSHSVTYNAKNQITVDTTNTLRGGVTYTNTSTYNYGSGAAYALGAALSVSTENRENGTLKSTSSLTNTYQWYEGSQLASVSYTTGSTTWTSTYNYLSMGGQKVLHTVTINDGRPRTVTFFDNMSGQILRRDEADNNTSAGDPHEIWYRFGGKEIAYSGNNGTRETTYEASIANRTAAQGTGAFFNGAASGSSYVDADESLAPINSYYQGSSGGSYVVKSGDTLSSIASQLWGDSSLWYKIAEANGLSGDATLLENQTLTIPSGVIKNTHSASTFNPYDPSAVLGDLSPTDPAPPKPAPSHKKHGCGGVGKILMIVVAVVVTIYTAGAAAGLIGGAGASSFGVGAAFSAAGGLATAAGGIAGGIAAGAIGGVVGSIASQAVGIATGVQDKFSWNAVALAGIGSAFGAGLAAEGGPLAGGGWGMAAARGAVGEALTEGIGVATGLQHQFSWAGVAAAGVGGAVGFKTQSAGPVAKTAVNALANAATHSLIDGSDFGDNVIAALPSAIGQTIGEGIAGRLAGSGTTTGGGAGTKGEQDHESLLDKIGHGLSGIVHGIEHVGTEIGDALGFDGQFGWQGAGGPNGTGRTLSLGGLGDAVGNVFASPAEAASMPPDVDLGATFRSGQFGGGVQTLQFDGNVDGLQYDIQDGPGMGHNSRQFGLEPLPEYDPTPRLPLPLAEGALVILGAVGVGSLAPHPSIEQANSIVRKVNSAISDHMTDLDLSAARRELGGEVVARRPDGTPYDHVDEVRGAQRSLLNSIGRARSMLSDTRTPDFIRPTVESALSRASRMLDYSERFVPRPTPAPTATP